MAGKDEIKPLQHALQKADRQEKALLGAGTAGMMVLDTTVKTKAPLPNNCSEMVFTVHIL